MVVGQELALVLHGAQAWLHDLSSPTCPEPSPYKTLLTHGWTMPCRLLQTSPTCVSNVPGCVTTLTCPTHTVPVWFYTGVQMGMDRWSFSKQRIFSDWFLDSAKVFGGVSDLHGEGLCLSCPSHGSCFCLLSPCRP